MQLCLLFAAYFEGVRQSPSWTSAMADAVKHHARPASKVSFQAVSCTETRILDGYATPVMGVGKE